ncbi:MAG: ClpX C4-type zinc finger protein, partial [Thermodesulfobacteriota bacterium]
MTEKEGRMQELCCSFCAKTQEEVQRLIAGPDVYICDECISLCNEILTHDKISEESESGSLLPPSNLKKKLDDHIIGQDQA